MRLEKKRRTARPVAILVVVLCSVIAVSGLYANGAQETGGKDKVYNLKFWHEHPETMDGMEELKELFTLLEERTNGRIVITPYWAETLAPRPESVNALRSGLADMGKFATMFNPGEFPVSDVASLPFLITSDEHVTKAFMECYNKGLMPEYEKSGIHVGTFTTAGSQMVMVKDNITQKEQFKGLSIRSQSPVTNAVVKAMGATPVAIGGGDVFMSLEKGMVEGAISSPIFMGMMKWYEVADYIIDQPLFYGMAFYGVNQKVWDSLPADLQEIMTAWFKDVAEYEISFGKIFYEQYKNIMIENGVEFLQIENAEFKKWKDATNFIIDDYIEDLNRRDLKGQEIIDIIRGTAD